MDEPLITPSPDGEPGVEKIGPYEVIELLGEGGMGAVYLAQQHEPFERRVAVKVMRSQANDRSLQRFESERRALARMSHPNVAQVYEAGSTQRGRPYIVMEHVPGLPIVRYCDENKLNVNQRLELFTAVCDGIQHAHEKGIIHRDIKPSNILVTEDGGRPIPKVIDFGIARAVDTPLTGETMTRDLVGTPSYISPEALELTHGKIDLDTRSDVYCLGILLYELLTGELPFGSDGDDFVQMYRRMVSDEVTPPCVRFRSLDAETRQEHAAARRTTPAALERRLRGDVGWIVVKAMARQRQERYGSAADLGEDVRRERRDIPLIAAPPGRIYRFKKLVQRHKVAAGATVLVFLALIGGFVARTLEAQRANREAEAAKQARQEADEVLSFLVGLFEVADPTAGAGADVTAREILEKGADRIHEELAGQPLAQARLMETIAEVYRHLGLYDEADPLSQEALKTRQGLLPKGHPDIATSLVQVATLRWRQGRFGEAEPMAREALQLREAIDAREQSVESALAVAEALDRVALILRRLGRYDEAQPYVEQAIDITEKTQGPDSMEMANRLNTLAILFWNRDQLEEAEDLFRRALGVRETLGEEHPEFTANLNNLAGVLRDLGRHAEAENHYQRALRLRRQHLGPDHPSVGYSLSNLALLYRRQERFEDAEVMLLQALEVWEAALGPEHPDVGFALNNLALTYAELGRHSDGIPYSQRALSINEARLGSAHPSVASSLNILAIMYGGAGRAALAEPLHLRAIRIYEDARDGSADPRIAWPIHSLANLYRDEGRMDEAEQLYGRALSIRQENLGADHPETVKVRKDLDELLRRSGRASLN